MFLSLFAAVAIEIVSPQAVQVTVATYPTEPLVGEIPRIEILIENTSIDTVRIDGLTSITTYCGRSRTVESDCDRVENCSAFLKRRFQVEIAPDSAAVIPIMAVPPSLWCDDKSELTSEVTLKLNSGGRELGETSVVSRFELGVPLGEFDQSLLDALLESHQPYVHTSVPLGLLSMDDSRDFSALMKVTRSEVALEMRRADFPNEAEFILAQDREIVRRLSNSEYAVRSMNRQACLLTSQELGSLLQPATDDRKNAEHVIESGGGRDLGMARLAVFASGGYSCCLKELLITKEDYPEWSLKTSAINRCGDRYSLRMAERFGTALSRIQH